MGKKKIICDTDALIDFFNENEKRHLKTKNIFENEIELTNILLSDVTIMELLKGATNKSELNKIRNKIIHFGRIPIEEKISELSIALIAKYSLSHSLSIPDALIAATSLQTNFELFTYNTKDFRFIENLKLFLH